MRTSYGTMLALLALISGCGSDDGDGGPSSGTGSATSGGTTSTGGNHDGWDDLHRWTPATQRWPTTRQPVSRSARSTRRSAASNVPRHVTVTANTYGTECAALGVSFFNCASGQPPAYVRLRSRKLQYGLITVPVRLRTDRPGNLPLPGRRRVERRAEAKTATAAATPARLMRFAACPPQLPNCVKGIRRAPLLLSDRVSESEYSLISRLAVIYESPDPLPATPRATRVLAGRREPQPPSC